MEQTFPFNTNLYLKTLKNPLNISRLRRPLPQSASLTAPSEREPYAIWKLFFLLLSYSIRKNYEIAPPPSLREVARRSAPAVLRDGGSYTNAHLEIKAFY